MRWRFIQRGQLDQRGPKGEITVLTQRTDLASDGTFDKYAAEFNKKYPDVKVTFQAIAEYENSVKTRLSGNSYGDVLAIPAAVKPSQYAQFFEPLGSSDSFKDKYRYATTGEFDGTTYGIASGGNANGIVYNKKVWSQAGITSLPKSEEEWLEALKKIKASTQAVPLYTNYKGGWPLTQGFGSVGAITGSTTATLDMATNKAPWTTGTDVYAIDSLLFDTVHEGLTESDPLSTDWEKSKVDLASGNIASMVLGSWAISQLQAAAQKVGTSPSDIGYMAWPATVNGKQYAVSGADYAYGVSKHSKNKAAAFAWIKWFTEESGYTDSQGMVSNLKDKPLPANLKDLSDNNVTLIEMDPFPQGKESLLTDTANDAKIDLYGPVYRQKLVDIARGAADGSKDSYFAQLNAQWGAAVDKQSK
ncbi:ABC transporter substrate-binding protein [Arthrobacter sp. SD76]|uniref:ABC transporter substrate-binding protein n=1 Tax=Arthrobacter sp. SD76 TaxID=3415007 RepID=UPI003C70E130